MTSHPGRSPEASRGQEGRGLLYVPQAPQYWKAAVERMSHLHVSQVPGREPSAPHRWDVGQRDAQLSGRPGGQGLRRRWV